MDMIGSLVMVVRDGKICEENIKLNSIIPQQTDINQLFLAVTSCSSSMKWDYLLERN
jgi:hypothetical protein